MPQKPTPCKGFTPRCSLSFSTKAYCISVKAPQINLLSVLRDLYWLGPIEPLSFILRYPEIRKAFKYGIGEFKAIYGVYKKSRGAVYGFNSRNLMSNRDLELSAKCTEMAVEIVGEGK